MSDQHLPLRPTTGVTTYDRLKFSKLTPVAGAIQTADAGVIVEESTGYGVETYSPGGPRFAIWAARASRRLRLRGLSTPGFDGITRRGAVMVIAPQSPTVWEAPEGSPGGIVVSIEPRAMENILQAAAFSRPPDWNSLENLQDRTICRLCALIEEELTRPSGHDRLFVSSLVSALTAHAVRTFSTAKRASDDKSRTTTLSGWRLRRVQDFVAAHLASDVTLSDLAQVVGLSTSHFSRVFKATVGSTPHAYVMDRRIELACTMLRATALPITEIAARAGFASQAHMTAMFRQRLAKTPGVVRSESRA